MSELPKDIAVLVDRARAAHAKGKQADAQKTLGQAFPLVGFPSTGVSVLYPIASELPPLARTLAEIVIREDLPAGFQWLPGGSAARRWIGLDPPGPLEREVEWGGREVPLWYALRTAEEAAYAERGKRGRTDPLAIVLAIPIGERLPVLAALGTFAWCYRILSQPYQYWELAANGLTTEGQAWAREAIARAVRPDGEPLFAHQLAFFALVRAGEPIAPAWDRFLPLGTHVPEAIVVECAKALPLDRLESVAPALLAQTYAQKVIDLGTAILRHHDSKVIAERVIATSARSAPHRRKVELAALATIAKRRPGVAEVLATALGGAPKSRSLTVTWRAAPRAPTDLTPIMAKQLVEAGRQWDRKTLPVERRLSVDENDEAAIGAVLEYVKLAEYDKPAFDAWLYAGDSGTFFVPSTTKVAALMIQGGIQLTSAKRDRALEDALGAIGTSKRAVRPLAEVKKATQEGIARRGAAATKKPAAKKPAAKKPAAKKPAATKPAAKKPATRR
jgi:hypothetical protein